MSDQGLCELAVVSLADPGGDLGLGGAPDQTDSGVCSSTLRYTNGTVKPGSSTDPGDVKLCSLHGSDLDKFCSSEGRLVCQACVSRGSCQGHTVTHLSERAAAVRVSETPHFT